MYNIPLTALGDLLDIFRKVVKDLPKDPRRIMGTPKQYHVSKICDGEYYHFGIMEGVQKQIKHLCDDLPENFCFELQLNIDGLPLFKSTSHQFWPILGNLCNIDKKKSICNWLIFWC